MLRNVGLFGKVWDLGNCAYRGNIPEISLCPCGRKYTSSSLHHEWQGKAILFVVYMTICVCVCVCSSGVADRVMRFVNY